MNGIDYLKEDIYNTERAKMRFVAEWDKVCKELKEAMNKRKGKNIDRPNNCNMV